MIRLRCVSAGCSMTASVVLRAADSGAILRGGLDVELPAGWTTSPEGYRCGAHSVVVELDARVLGSRR